MSSLRVLQSSVFTLEVDWKTTLLLIFGTQIYSFIFGSITNGNFDSVTW